MLLSTTHPLGFAEACLVPKSFAFHLFLLLPCTLHMQCLWQGLARGEGSCAGVTHSWAPPWLSDFIKIVSIKVCGLYLLGTVSRCTLCLLLALQEDVSRIWDCAELNGSSGN